MSLRFCSFSSGSSGNCYLVSSENTAILIDAGISASRIVSSLERIGMSGDDIDAVFITHEHSDHVGGLMVSLKRLKNARIFASGATFEALENPKRRIHVADDRKTVFVPGDSIELKDLSIETVELSHDAADPSGFVVAHEDKKIALITDTGIFTAEMLSCASGADIMVIESNYDEQMLRSGGYPPMLKQRIAGPYGHLSNADAAKALIKICGAQRKSRLVLLAHLSKDNNTPKTAEKTVLSALKTSCANGEEKLALKSLSRDAMSVVFEL